MTSEKKVQVLHRRLALGNLEKILSLELQVTQARSTALDRPVAVAFDLDPFEGLSL